MAPGIAWVAGKRPLPLLRWIARRPPPCWCWRGSRGSRASPGTRYRHHADLQLAALWLRRARARRSGPRATCCAGAATTRPARILEAAAILFTVLLVFFEIRHAMNGGDIYATRRRACGTGAAGLGRPRHRHRARMAARPHRQHRPQCRRARWSPGSPSLAIVIGLGRCREPAGDRRAGRRAVPQPDPARLRAAGGAGDRARTGRAPDPSDGLPGDLSGGIGRRWRSPISPWRWCGSITGRC